MASFRSGSLQYYSSGFGVFFYSTGCFLTAYVEGNLIDSLKSIMTLLRDRQAFVHCVMPLSRTFQYPALPKTKLYISPILQWASGVYFFALVMSVSLLKTFLLFPTEVLF